MNIFNIVFFKIISVLLSVVVGFFAGRYAKVERDSISSLLFYFISPIVFFSIPAGTNVTVSDIGITIVTFVISSGLCAFAFYFFSRYWQDNTVNILSMSAGTSNCGYFMLPIAAALFDDNILNIYMMAIIGVNVYESSIGYFICAKSTHTSMDSLKRMIKLPTLNAFILGCLFSLAGLNLPDFLDDFTYGMRSAYSVLGMVMVGLGMSGLQKFEIDFNFTSASFLSKFVFFPVAINLFIFFDKFIFGWYNENYYDALQLMSLAPVAANTIVLASIWKFNQEKVAATVLLSSIFALLYIPIMASLLIRDLG